MWIKGNLFSLTGSKKGKDLFLCRVWFTPDNVSAFLLMFANKPPIFLVLLVSIDSIQEVCEGKQSEIFQRYADGSFDPNCCFSIYYGDHMESLDLVSSSGEEARTWITGLKYLMAGISDEDSLSKRQRTRDQYPLELGKGCQAGVVLSLEEFLGTSDCLYSWRQMPDSAFQSGFHLIFSVSKCPCVSESWLLHSVFCLNIKGHAPSSGHVDPFLSPTS